MYKKSPQGWLKHWDFFLLDLIVMQVSLILGYMIYQERTNFYMDDFYRTMAFVLFSLQVFAAFFMPNYKDILKRGYLKEARRVFTNAFFIFLMMTAFLFISKQGEQFSRGTYLMTAAIFMLLSYCVRIWRKNGLKKKYLEKKYEARSMVVVSDKETIQGTLDELLATPFTEFEITGLVIADDPSIKEVQGIPVIAAYDSMLEYLCRQWVDEVFISSNLPEQELNKLIGELELMGITVHVELPVLSGVNNSNQFVERMGKSTVLTTGINLVNSKQLFFKRAMDILGGLAGCILTGIIYIFIAPIIYKQSPGPIFFKQTRIGKNGRTFKMYKFRSMYMDAEARKAELMKQNKVQSGLMFKMDNDPRIIGSEKIRKDGTPGGIGNFIRRTSLDEFPQFLNVLKGDMSLVGTRPPTLDEWNHYDLHHRARMAIKPGITGMWQANGRSEITDFEEVVRLDLEYIRNWSFGLDIKILYQTFLSVVRRQGAE